MSNATKERKISIIFDDGGSIYMGTVLSETSEYYLLHNPAQIFYNVKDDTKDIEITVIPVCIPEILSEESKKKGTTWIYKKNHARFVSYSDVQIDNRIIDYYMNIFNNVK